jgi:hypothetical protein
MKDWVQPCKTGRRQGKTTNSPTVVFKITPFSTNNAQKLCAIHVKHLAQTDGARLWSRQERAGKARI